MFRPSACHLFLDILISFSIGLLGTVVLGSFEDVDSPWLHSLTTTVMTLDTLFLISSLLRKISCLFIFVIFAFLSPISVDFAVLDFFLSFCLFYNLSNLWPSILVLRVYL